MPALERDGYQVVAWRRFFWDDGKLPFLRSNYGPHTWCEALVTVKIVVPFVNEHVPQGQPKIQLCHSGIQLITQDCEFSKKLNRYCIRPPLQRKAFGKVTPVNIVKAMVAVPRLEWMALNRNYNLDAFEYLVDGWI